MGIYLNPSNAGFARALRSQIYVDKSELIAYTNMVLDTEQQYVCVSRPRRFGKSMTAKMLSAYYCRTCDSEALFANLKIAKHESYKQHLNQYDVISVDMNDFLTGSSSVEMFLNTFQRAILKDLQEVYTETIDFSSENLIEVLQQIYVKTGTMFIFIIDEWDCVLRSAQNDKESHKIYLDYLRTLLKGKEYICLAYMTGILPIKKYGTHSALNMFDEFSMTDQRKLAAYTGFTEEEVKMLCNMYAMDFEETKRWYDGYRFSKASHIYNPKSVVTAMLNERFGSYWTQTESYEALKAYIEMNFDGLRDTIVQLLGGGRCKINTETFTNDMTTFHTKDDILTLLIHLGYLAYDIEYQEVFIPNEEVRKEFVNAVTVSGWQEVLNMIRKNETGGCHMGELQKKGHLAKEASYYLAVMTTEEKNKGLLAMADALERAMEDVMAANALDMEVAKANGKPQAFLDRLLLNESRIKDMADGIRAVAELPDPVGHVEEMWLNKDNLQIGKIAVPLGVIGMIYEARPNVTADAAALCLKAGNAVMLRGSGDAIESNKKIAAVLSSAAEQAGIPHGAIQLVEDTSRETANEMMRLNEYLDVLIPRGGAGLIQNVVKNATVPVIETGVGNCHIYVDETADLQMAVDIIMNGKVQRPGVCNATESLLVHKNVAEKLLPMAAEQLLNAGVELRGCAETIGHVSQCNEATESDYATEFHSLILSVKVVESIDEAILHIRQYGTKHSEVIVTNDYANARKFQQMVDAAVVYVNASSRFSDGFQFGFGAEIGISTQKLHARGPMGLKALTSYKYIVNGAGQVRK